jgi:hypothetical protein
MQFWVLLHWRIEHCACALLSAAWIVFELPGGHGLERLYAMQFWVLLHWRIEHCACVLLGAAWIVFELPGGHRQQCVH